jgi:uroporphyrinogen-III synthase
VTSRLAGFTVGVTADRRRDDQAVLLTRLGVEVVLGPVLRTEEEPVDDDLLVATKRIIADPPDVLVANTGFGIRSWWARAAAWGLDAELTAALHDTRLVARGPKASGALRSLGLPVWWRSPTEQLESVVDHLVSVGVVGEKVALQLHGEDSRAVIGRLRAAGAAVHEVPVYRWALPTDDRAAVELIRRCCVGSVDAVTFTAGPAVRQFLDLAEAEGLAAPLLAALNDRMIVVCVGPVCAGVAREEGILAPIVPEHWRLGAMVKVVGSSLAERSWEIPAESGVLTIRGGRLDGPDGVVQLPLPARRDLAVLIGRGGGPVPAAELEPVDELRRAVPAVAHALIEIEDGRLVRLAGRCRPTAPDEAAAALD